MNMIDAIRALCKGENGFVNMFDPARSQGKLARFTEGHVDSILFETMLYGQAKSALLELIHDSYNFKAYITWIHSLLMDDGMSEAEAKRTLDYFFTAFGFPGYRQVDPAKVSTVSDTVGENFKVEYEGEVENGKEYGVGARNCYHHGKWCSLDECVWVSGVMIGYDFAKEIEFGAFEIQKIGFVVEDYFVGNIKCFCGEDEEIDAVSKFTV